MNNIEWKDGTVCYTDAGQWVLSEVKKTLKRAKGERRVGFEQALNQLDFKLNEIRTGDFIPASELDTEQKYNEVVEVFGLFGHGLHMCNSVFSRYKTMNFTVTAGGCCYSRHGKRKLTYHQIIAIGKLKRMMLERAVPAVEFGVVADNGNSDQVKNPTHYQLVEGVESIEIIARSMTKEQFKGYCLGNMLKYRLRAGKKDALQQDIAKADFYGDLYEMHKEKCYD